MLLGLYFLLIYIILCNTRAIRRPGRPHAVGRPIPKRHWIKDCTGSVPANLWKQAIL